MTTAYTHIDVRKFAGALGAEIGGVDLAQPLDNETFAEIHRAFLDNLVVCFRDQHLTPDQHKAFGRRFGSLNVHPYAPALEGHPEVMTVFKEKDDTANFGGGWHSDMTFLEKPVLGSMLYARDVPPHGGDTLFLNMYLAYDALSDGMKTMLGRLRAVHSANKQYGVDGSEAAVLNEQRTMKPRTSAEAKKEVTHPVVRTHPETGRKCLFVNRAFVERFDGWTRQESQPLLRWLYEHYTRPEFTCRLRWTADALAFWDNRCTQHYALNDYHGFRREMHRVTIDGDRVY